MILATDPIKEDERNQPIVEKKKNNLQKDFFFFDFIGLEDVFIYTHFRP